jgi:anti-anti-sigma factor
MAADHVPSTAASRRSVRLIRLGSRPSNRSSGTAGPVFELIGQSAPGGVTWLWARKDLDMATTAAARRELSALLDPAHDAGVVLVYLGQEHFIDLRGLRLLLLTAALIRSRGGALAVVAPPHCLQRMVRLGRLDTELPLVTTARHAVWWARRHKEGLR